MKTLEDMWKDFEADVMPKDAPPIQQREMRRAYYAGMAIMFYTLTTEMAGLSEDDAVEALTSFQAQLLAFVERVTKGEA